MKNPLILGLSILMLASCGRHAPKEQPAAPREFINDNVVRTTPVRDQGRSPLCWAYAMAATIESEHLMQGDSVTLSTDYLARLLLRDAARRAFLSRGEQPVSLRGMMTMTTDLMAQYGIVPLDTYDNLEGVNYTSLAKKAQSIARAATTLTCLDQRLADVMDEDIGYLPRLVAMLGMTYTPRQFAESVCLPGEYDALTSFTHHPFYQPFVLETPDNQLRDRFLNIPIDTLMHRVVRALRQGHPVCWEGDISEPGFDWPRGRATLPADRDSHHRSLSRPATNKAAVTQQQRQRAFERRLTTDDHCLELCGLAHDRDGRPFFLAKNSWGRTNRYGGFIYLSYNYVKMKTIAVCIPRSAK